MTLRRRRWSRDRLAVHKTRTNTITHLRPAHLTPRTWGRSDLYSVNMAQTGAGWSENYIHEPTSKTHADTRLCNWAESPGRQEASAWRCECNPCTRASQQYTTGKVSDLGPTLWDAKQPGSSFRRRLCRSAVNELRTTNEMSSWVASIESEKTSLKKRRVRKMFTVRVTYPPDRFSLS